MAPQAATNAASAAALIDSLGIVGTGTMGRGIAQLACTAGLTVRLFDSRAGAAAAAIADIDKTLSALCAKERLTVKVKAAAMARLHPVATLDGLVACQIVVEAIVEDLAQKQALFRTLETLLPRHAILATNTSSLSVTAIAAACHTPQRVVGWHFFNPVPLMRLAEVVAGLHTDAALPHTMAGLTARLGHRAILAQDTPGFIVNHAGRAFIPEGLRLLAEGIAPHHEIDAVLRDCAGFRMGPFELADLVGLDNAQDVMTSLYREHCDEPRFRTTPLVRTRVAGGLLGRKTGRGFYRYEDGRRLPDDPVENGLDDAVVADPARIDRPVWIAWHEPDLADRVAELLAAGGATLEAGVAPSADALIVITPVGADVSTACHEHGLDARRTVAVDALFSLRQRCTLMAAPALDAGCRRAATALFAASGRRVTWLRDSPGFVAQRMVAQIVQIACEMAQQRLAAPADIDSAVTLALGYPHGPFAWAASLGVRRVLQIADALHRCYQEPRYRPSPWLRRRAEQGLSADHPD